KAFQIFQKSEIIALDYDPRSIHNKIVYEYGRAKTYRQRYSIGCPRVDIKRFVTVRAHQFGKENTVNQVIDQHLLHLNLKIIGKSLKEIVRQGAARLHFFNFYRNSLRFKTANNNRQTPISTRLSQNQCVRARLCLTV